LMLRKAETCLVVIRSFINSGPLNRVVQQWVVSSALVSGFCQHSSIYI
jgi:hypothetical protein